MKTSTQLTIAQLTALQSEFERIRAEYLVALYANPRDEEKCLDLAEQKLKIARGTRLEARQIAVVQRHLRKLGR